MPRILLIALLCIVSGGFAGGEGVSGDSAADADRPNDPAEQIVAEVDGQPISGSAFAEHYMEYLLRTGTRDEARLRRAVLTQIVNDRLLVADAISQGIESTPAYRAHLETVRDKLAIELYLERHVLGAIEVTESELEEAFVRINTTLTAKHLFARTRDEVDDLYARLTDGANFDELARATFSDTVLANNGGALGSFTFDETDPDFEDAAYGLAVGEISKPVRTAHGYSIIQLTNRYTHPILTESDFAKRKAKLHRLVLRKKRAQARTHYIRRLADDASIAFHEPALGQLLGQITGMSVMESLESFLEQPLVSFAGVTWTVAAFRMRAQETDPRRRAAVRTEADLREFVSGLIVRDELLARAQPLRREPEYESAVERVMDEWILASKKEELAGSVRIPDDDMRAHFALHAHEYRGENDDPLSFEGASSRIREELLYHRTQEAVLRYLADLRRRHEISVHDDVLLALPIAGHAVHPAPLSEQTAF